MAVDAQNSKTTNARLKVVVRRLPPNLPESVFTGSLVDFVDTFKAIKFMPGKLATRCYITFPKTEALLNFSKAYDGHVFVDKSGAQFKAVVEFAPFQKWIDTTSKRRKADPRINTLDKDPEYIAFLESLANPDTSVTGAEGNASIDDLEYFLSKKENHPAITPLLASIKSESRKKKVLKGSSAKDRSKKGRKKRLEVYSGGSGKLYSDTGAWAEPATWMSSTDRSSSALPPLGDESVPRKKKPRKGRKEKRELSLSGGGKGGSGSLQSVSVGDTTPVQEVSATGSSTSGKPKRLRRKRDRDTGISSSEGIVTPSTPSSATPSSSSPSRSKVPVGASAKEESSGGRGGGDEQAGGALPPPPKKFVLVKKASKVAPS